MESLIIVNKNDLRELILELIPMREEPVSEEKDYFLFGEGLEYINSKGLKISESTLYKKTANKEIPFQRWGGKQVVFLRQELDQWISERLIGNDATGGDEITNTVAEKARKKGRA